MEILIKAGQLILSLSILIVLHELGHFIPARLFKTRVEKFYLFFNPWFSLFKVKRGETEYGLGWLPLGGYVKISGMVDESMDKEQMKLPPQPYEFRAKPAWQRLIIMLGGVTVNFILGYVIFIFMLWTWGKDYLPTENAKYGMYIQNDELRATGLLKDGDQILTVGGEKPKTYQEAGLKIVIDRERSMQVLREGEKVDVMLPEDIHLKLMGGSKLFMVEQFPYVIDSVVPDKPAAKAGFMKGDSIVGVDDLSAAFFHPVDRYVKKKKSSDVVFHIYRDGNPMDLTATTDENGIIGVAPKTPDKFLTYQHEDFSFLESIPAGISDATDKLTTYVKSLSLLFTAEGAGQLGGFGSIGSLFPPEWNWHAFWSLTAFLSLMLAFMNLLPIPALDGGHVLFLLYEIVRGKAPGQKFMEYAQLTGMILLLGLIVFANAKDIQRFFFGG
jgi:regulator of sigma E protease